MQVRCAAEVVYWRGPAPFVFAVLPELVGARIRALAGTISYGWGVVPVTARIGSVDFSTSLIPRQGTYFLPIKVAAQRALGGVEIGATLEVELDLKV